MTTLTIGVIYVAGILFSVVYTVYGLGGSATTVSVSYGATVSICGIVAGQPTQHIQCWRNGQLFDVYSDISFESIAGGRDLFCGIRSGGSSLVCWSPDLIPKRLYYNETVTLSKLAIGDSQICSITNRTGSNVDCWRDREGFSTQNGRFQSISSGLGFTCGIQANNTYGIICFGTNSELASSIQSEFINFRMLNVAVGGNHACGVNSTGFLICRGNNDYRQIEVPNHQPFEFSALALGLNHTCALRRLNNSVICWGGGGGIMSDYELDISFESIVAGLDFTCGLTTNNLSVICWGEGWVRNGSFPLGFELPLRSILPGPCFSNSSPVSRSSTIRRQASRAFRRQRSGTSSKHADREEEFTFADLALATNNFSHENKIGAGSFGVVYKGKLLDGREVAIKRGETSQKAKKFQEKESAFDSELAFLSRLHHKHLVRLVGYCEEREEKLLVYEYMKNGALYDHLHDKKNVDKNSSLLNSWKMRIKIALDAARGIEYLHNYAVPPIIHRDIKSSNILLDTNWVARVSDFGLSLMGPESESEHRPAKAAGTVGYIDPEYYGLNVVTAKSDVYGLGVVMLELLTGKRAIFKSNDDTNDGAPISLVDYAVPAIISGELTNALDKRVRPPEVNEAEAVELMAYTAMHCVKLEGRERPTMTDIVANLERALSLCDDSHGSISSDQISIISE
ncbi:hypothetical protein E3N88_42929 [Mikania micrantha]|uniref:non-specific serine/threonine protein kinase n=1 Tax=Mikania micrantha TaxID=192012 RepID=A0A5N6LGC4_9ASTR|nr:hypothetical protein E3N88_42929 [Mikania micrantha]